MFYKEYFKYSRDILLIMELNGKILEANDAAIEAYGYTEDEIKRLTIHDLRNPQTLKVIAGQLNQAVKSGILFETIHRRKDGSTFQVEVSSQAIPNKGKNVLLSIIRDITHRKQLEDALVHEKSNYYLLFNNMLSGFALHEVIWDSSGQAVDYLFLDVNMAFEIILGFNKQAVIGKTLKEVIPLIDEYWIKAYGRVALQGEKIRFEKHITMLNKDLLISAFSPQKGQLAVVFEEVTEYRQTQRSLHDANEQLALLNEELTATNEEFMATNEELTATNEQLTATEEELTAYNQELHSSQEALKLSHQKLKESETIFRELAENARDMIYRISLLPTPHFEYINQICESVTGFAPEEFYQDINTYHQRFHPDEREEIDTLLQGKLIANSTLRWIHRDGHVIWLEVFRTAIYDETGKMVAVQGIARDINDRKAIELQLKYMNQHDAVTGIYNRSYFEEELTRLDQLQEEVGLIIADLDRLKLINDTFGHKAGDNLLKIAAQIINSAFSYPAKVARIGGDEFAVIVPDCTEERLIQYCQVIKEKMDQYNEKQPEVTLSISMGYALKNKAKNMNETFIEADNYMYRAKLQRSKSSKSSVINTLIKAMEARDFITEGHAERLITLVKLMATSLELPTSKAYDICLLAQFHDIGKVGIPDQILFKPGALTKDERTQMNRHSEIGYRIAQASIELLPIADWILKHHERWDGEGYPLGLKGEEIPIECRILAIADSYDAMTNDRPYRKALSHGEAIKELKACAGTQFDPSLVPLAVQVLDQLLV